MEHCLLQHLEVIKEAAKESGKPTLKQAFTYSNQANPEKSTPAASKNREEVHSVIWMQ